LEVLLVLAVLAVVVWLIAGPLRSRAGPGAATGETEPGSEFYPADRAELQAAKEAKYREIRDAELDYRTGKLSDEDWRRLDRELRAEALELLRRLDAEVDSSRRK
jgi:hypothetical protein